MGVLELWSQTFPLDEEEKEAHAPTEDQAFDRVSGLIRFIKAARVKKMVQFGETKVTLL